MTMTRKHDLDLQVQIQHYFKGKHRQNIGRVGIEGNLKKKGKEKGKLKTKRIFLYLSELHNNLLKCK